MQPGFLHRDDMHNYNTITLYMYVWSVLAHTCTCSVPREKAWLCDGVMLKLVPNMFTYMYVIQHDAYIDAIHFWQEVPSVLSF